MAGEGLLGALLPDENALLAEDPFYLSGVNVLRAPMGRPSNNWEAILMPTLQGLVGGGLTGYGRAGVSDQLETGYDNIMGSLLGDSSYSLQSGFGPVASGDQYGKMVDAGRVEFNPQTAKSQLALALMGQQQRQDISELSAKTKGEIAKIFLDKYGAVQDPNTGLPVQVPGLAGFKQALEGGGPGGKLGLSDSDRTKILEQKALVDEGMQISKELRSGAFGTASLVAGSYLSALDPNQINQRITNWADRILRSRSGAAAPIQEQARLRAIASGDFSALINGPNKVADMIDKFADAEIQNIESKLSSASQLKGGIFEQEIRELNKSPNNTALNMPGLPSVGGIFNGEKVVSVKKVR